MLIRGKKQKIQQKSNNFFCKREFSLQQFDVCTKGVCKNKLLAVGLNGFGSVSPSLEPENQKQFIFQNPMRNLIFVGRH
jgi:hypothetical protein